MSTKLRLLSSLEKVFPEETCPKDDLHRGSMLRNEIYSFQVACTTDKLLNYTANVGTASLSTR